MKHVKTFNQLLEKKTPESLVAALVAALKTHDIEPKDVMEETDQTDAAVEIDDKYHVQIIPYDSEVYQLIKQEGEGDDVKFVGVGKGTNSAATVVEMYLEDADVAVEESVKMPSKGSADWHQLQIARKTVKMTGAMAGMMGGMSVEEAKEILKKYGLKS